MKLLRSEVIKVFHKMASTRLHDKSGRVTQFQPAYSKKPEASQRKILRLVISPPQFNIPFAGILTLYLGSNAHFQDVHLESFFQITSGNLTQILSSLNLFCQKLNSLYLLSFHGANLFPVTQIHNSTFFSFVYCIYYTAKLIFIFSFSSLFLLQSGFFQSLSRTGNILLQEDRRFAGRKTLFGVHFPLSVIGFCKIISSFQASVLSS